MSNAITQSNRVAPWLGVGAEGAWESSAEALRAADLDFTVRQEELYWQREDKELPHLVYNEKAPMFANVKDDDDRLLGCVTPQYKIIQNRDAFALLDPFVQSNDGVITNAGMTEDGLVFMVTRIQTERIIGNEPYEINLMLTNSFNTKYPCQIIMTPIRIYCQNMYRKLINDRIFLAKHTNAAHDRLLQMAQGNAIERKVDTFSQVIENTQGKMINERQLIDLIGLLFPYPKEGGPREQAYRLKVDERREKFKDHYLDAPDNKDHQGTAFGFINAYFDYLSHRNTARNISQQEWVDRRFSGIVSGMDVNTKALHEALR